MTAAVGSMTVESFRQPYPAGEKISPSPNFSGEVWLASLSGQRELNVPMFNVTFAPACRNNWHSHTGGQILIATAGIGYYQEQGQPARRLFPGDIVEIPAGMVHWHGAAPDSWFAHVAIECNPQTNKTTWLQPVNDKEYAEATAQSVEQYAEANRTLTDREHAIVATVSILAGVSGVEPMAYGHMGICLHLGITSEQLTALLNIVETNLGPASATPLREVLKNLTTKE